MGDLMKKNKNIISKSLNILLLIFSILFIIYPLGFSFINGFYFLLATIVVIIIITCCKYVPNLSFKIKNIDKKYFLIIIILLAVLTRVGVVLFFEKNVQQVSDFAIALKSSKNLDFSGDYYRVFTHWILYPYLVSFVYKLFGNSQLVALIVNSIILIINSILIYCVTSKLSNKKTGFIAGLIYVFWPANILYTLVFTQEHFVQMLFLIVMLLFVSIEQNENIKFSKKIFLSFMIGILLGLSVFFKNFAPVFLIAFVIYYILKILKIHFNKKIIINSLAMFITIFVSFFMMKEVIFLKIDNMAGHKVLRSPTICYLNVGLRNDGRYNKETYQEYFDKMVENNYDYEKTNKIILNNLLKETKKNKNIGNLLKQKAKMIFGGDYERLEFVETTISNTNIQQQNIYGKIENLNNLYYVCIMLLLFIGLFSLNSKKNLLNLLNYLIIFGSGLLILLVEAQNRYMYSLYGFLCILSAIGINSIKEFVDTNKLKKCKKRLIYDIIILMVIL